MNHNNIKDHEVASEGEELDFDLSKLAKRLSISSEDWQFERGSPALNRSLKQEQSYGTSSLADGMPESSPDRDGSPQRSTLAPKATTPRVPDGSSNASSQVAGPSLSGGDASWFQALTRPTSEQDKQDSSIDSPSKQPAHSALALPKGSSLEPLMDPEGSNSGSTTRIRPQLLPRRTVANGAPDPNTWTDQSTATAPAASSSDGFQPQYALNMPHGPSNAEDSPASRLREKRRSLRSASSKASDEPEYFMAPDALRRSLSGSSQHSHHHTSPRNSASITASPAGRPQRPPLQRAGSSGYMGSRDRSASIGRKSSHRHSRSSSRASIHVSGSGAAASPVVSRRTSSYRSVPAYVKGKALGLEAEELVEVLREDHYRMFNESDTEGKLHKSHPLVLDTRPLPTFLGPSGRIKGSINCNFPSLLTKRFKRGKIGNFVLQSFITTEVGKMLYQHISASVAAIDASRPPAENKGGHETELNDTPTASSTSDGGPANSLKELASLDIFVVDDQIKDLDGSSTGAILVSVLEQALAGQVGTGSLCYLHGKFPTLVTIPSASDWIVRGEEADQAFLQSQHPSDMSEQQFSKSQTSGQPASKQLNIHGPSRLASTPALQPIAQSTTDATPPSYPPPRKSSHAQLQKLDTSENVAGASRSSSAMPSAASAPEGDGHMAPSQKRTSNMSLQEICRMQAKSPKSTGFDSAIKSRVDPTTRQNPMESSDNRFTEHRVTSPSAIGTPRQESEEFLISTIIPGFIFLGPEPQNEEDVEQLKKFGIHQILNMALEIDEGILSNRFEKYVKIPMRDFVDETGVQGRIDEACALLDDANLKSKCVYVHCRAGKSRSVTIVLAYLIHRYHWTLSRAYEHVAERRHGISPNIGFMSELMRFEERALGNKPSERKDAVSSVPATSGGASSNSTSTKHASPSSHAPSPSAGRALTGMSRIRESLPPMKTSSHATEQNDVESFTSGDREQEVKGYTGAWVHARRDQMSERFQPNRRASKAGLESTWE